MKAERLQEPQARVDDVLHPDGLADAARADLGRDLDQLPAGEEPERLAVCPEVAAEAVELVVPTRHQLLDHRPEGLCVGVRPLDLDRRLAAEGLSTELTLEADRVLRLDEHGEAQFLGCRARLGAARWIARLGHVDLRGDRRFELAALVLDRLEHVPGRERKQEAREAVPVARECVQGRVVGREDDGGRSGLLHSGHESVLVGGRVGRPDRRREARAEAEGTGPVIERQHGDPGPPERANRGQAVDPADIDDEGFHSLDSRRAAVFPDPSHRAASRYARPRSPGKSRPRIRSAHSITRRARSAVRNP